MKLSECELREILPNTMGENEEESTVYEIERVICVLDILKKNISIMYASVGTLVIWTLMYILISAPMGRMSNVVPVGSHVNGVQRSIFGRWN